MPDSKYMLVHVISDPEILKYTAALPFNITN